MKKLAIKGILLDQENQMPVLLLNEEQSDRYLTLGIGPSEASSIISVLENVIPPRPLTHDLISQMFQKHKFKVKKVELDHLYEDKCQAVIHYRFRFRNYTLEIRPSDAVAIALREKAPIMGSDKLISNLEINFGHNNESDEGFQNYLYLNFCDHSYL